MMLSQKFYRRDAEKRRSRTTRFKDLLVVSRSALFPILFTLCLCASAVNFSCASKTTDLRTLVPADSLIYLESNDLAAALQPIIDNKAFIKAGKTKPDISALKGIQLAVTVSGFEMTEEKLTDEHSVGRVQPRFVAIADTHAWNWQAVSFAESQIGSFVMDIYRSDVSQEKVDKYGGSMFTWTADDGRKAFALVIGSLVYFGNDETAIEKCLAVKRGEAEGFIKTGKVASHDPGTLAAGYISPDGVAQIASILGLTMAADAADDAAIQSAIAGIVPQLIRGAVSEITWTAAKNGAGYDDRYSVTLASEVARVFAETVNPSGSFDPSLFEIVPADLPSVTAYNVEKPTVAYRSVLLTSRSLLEGPAGQLLVEFSGALAEPYGISDPELFLSGVGPTIVTGNLDPNGDKPVVIANVAISENVRRSIDTTLRPDSVQSSEFQVEFLRSADGELSAAFFDNKVVIGDSEAVASCLKARSGLNIASNSAIVHIFPSNASATTLAIDTETSSQIAAVLLGETVDAGFPATTSITETRFTRTGIDRRTTSELGLIGSIIARLGNR
jgi:hypothetical protein